MRLILLVFILTLSSTSTLAEPFSAQIHYAGLLLHDKETLAYKSLSQTHKVPAKLGEVFGIYYELSGGGTKKGIQLKEVVRSSQGGEIFRNTRTQGEGKVLAFRFDEPFELIEGEWTFEVWLGNELLMAQQFDVSRSHTSHKGQPDGVITSYCDTDIKTGSNRPVKTCAPMLVKK